jgi:HemY protein
MRILVALAVIAAAVALAVYFAGNPGHVEIAWQGWLIDTSVGVLVGLAALLAMLVAGLALAVAALRRMPRNLRRRRAGRRRHAGERELTRGIVALAAGRAVEAQRHANRAGALLEGAAMPILLAAEAAGRQGDAASARAAYTSLLASPETEFLGLRGLIGQALRAGDDATAQRLAERARLLRPDAPWLAESLLVLEARADEWQAARDTLAAAERRQAIPAERARHHRGVVLHQMSLAAERAGDLREAVRLAARAQRFAPDLAALAYHHAGLLKGLGRVRAAARVIESTWRLTPHPELARLYLEIRPNPDPLARAAALQRLGAANPGAIETHLSLAEAALAAQLWGEARHHLAAAGAAPTGSPAVGPSAASDPALEPSRRLCLLMARLEEGETGDLGASRAWLDRTVGAPPDPTYRCRNCGGESGQWQALCPHCGAFDTLFWGTPPATFRPLLPASPESAISLVLPPADAARIAGRTTAPPRHAAERLGEDGAMG